MKGDFSKNTFNKTKHYNTVRMQQGRVQLDADWNEQMDILAHRGRTEAVDLIGGSGTPLDDDGFAISVVDDQGTADNLQIGAGRYYVNGLLCEHEVDSLITAQPDYPVAALEALLPQGTPLADGLYLVYLVAWQRHVTQIEDPGLAEPALAGVDTTTRLKTLAQVKLLGLDSEGIDDFNCDSVFDSQAAVDSAAYRNAQAWQDLSAASSGQLTAQVNNSADLRNRLYRVEIHRGGSREELTFKWSRDNAIALARIKQLEHTGDSASLIIEQAQNSQQGGFEIGQWLELFHEEDALKGLPGLFVYVVNIEEGALITTWSPDMEPDKLADGGGLVRRWDTQANTLAVATLFLAIPPGGIVQGDDTLYVSFDNAADMPSGLSVGQAIELSNESLRSQDQPGYFVIFQALSETTLVLGGNLGLEAVEISTLTLLRVVESGTLAVGPDDFIALEDGLEIKFHEGLYRSGDYWLIPARASNNDIDWPQGQAQSPQGIRYDYVSLSLVNRLAGQFEISPEYDCRILFSSLADLKSLEIIEADANAPAGAIHVDNAGQIGLGTDTPQTTLDVSGAVRVQHHFQDLELLSSYTAPDGDYAYRAIHIRDTIAYIAADLEGLHILDIGNPAQPFLIGKIDTDDPSDRVLDLVVVGDYAYVANGVSGLQIFNISDPTAPTKLGSHTSPNAQAIAVVNNIAYIADLDSGLHLVDVVNPDSPSLNRSIALTSARDVVVLGNYAYIAGDMGLATVDIINPTSTPVVFSLPEAAMASCVSVSGQYAYLGTSEALHIVEVENPDNPLWLASLPVAADIKAIAVVADRAYLASDSAGLQIVDIADPLQPKLVNELALAGNGLGIAVTNSKAYVVHDGPGLQSVDLITATTEVILNEEALSIETRETEAPRAYKKPLLTHVATYQTTAEVHSIAVVDDYAYLLEPRTGNPPSSLQIIDIRSVEAPVRVGAYSGTLKQGNHVRVAAPYAYIADGDDSSPGLQVLDIGAAETPLSAGSSSELFNATALSVLDNTAYVVGDTASAAMLWTYDLSSLIGAPTTDYPLTLIAESAFQLGVDIQALGIAVLKYGDKIYACVCSDASLSIIDVTDQQSPTLIASADPLSTSALSVEVSGHYAYVAYDLYGVHIFDLRPTFENGSPPVIVASYTSIIGNAQQIRVAGNYAYIADDESGLKVIDVRDPLTPVLVDKQYTADKAKALAIQGNYVYVADAAGGLRILSIQPKTKISNLSSSYFANKLGIGTTTPEHELEVNGVIKAHEFITDNQQFGNWEYEHVIIRGIQGGGYAGSTSTNHIHQTVFATETTSRVPGQATMNQAKQYGVGVSGRSHGYFIGTYSSTANSAGAQTKIDKFIHASNISLYLGNGFLTNNAQSPYSFSDERREISYYGAGTECNTQVKFDNVTDTQAWSQANGWTDASANGAGGFHDQTKGWACSGANAQTLGFILATEAFYMVNDSCRGTGDTGAFNNSLNTRKGFGYMIGSNNASYYYHVNKFNFATETWGRSIDMSYYASETAWHGGESKGYVVGAYDGVQNGKSYIMDYATDSVFRGPGSMDAPIAICSTSINNSAV
ncbi:MAG: DUF6519 domain-containing protein [Pseudomonadales bacterium]